jgi:F-type H+-transporting ATPase subunit b
MRIDPGVIIWTLIIFGVLLVVLKLVAWKPILKTLNDREERIRASLERAREVKAESEKAWTDQKALLEREREQIRESMVRISQDASKKADGLLESARKDANELMAQTRIQIDLEKERAIELLRSQAVELAISAASHLLQKSMDESTHRLIVTDYINHLPQNLRRH